MAVLLASSIGPPFSSAAPFSGRGDFAFALAAGGFVVDFGADFGAALADADLVAVVAVPAFADFSFFAERFVVDFAVVAFGSFAGFVVFAVFAVVAFVVFVVFASLVLLVAFVVFSLCSSDAADGRFVRVLVLVATLNSSLRQPPWPAL